jgi:hypothetical protein
MMKSEIESLIEEARKCRHTNPKKGEEQPVRAETLLRSATNNPHLIKHVAQWQWVQGAYLAQDGKPDEVKSLIEKF